jgi:hypothetical protein
MPIPCLPPNPPFQPTASREIAAFLMPSCAARLRRLNGNPLGGGSSYTISHEHQYGILALADDFGMEMVAMTRIYYRLWYRLDHIDGYLIWFSNDEDGVVTQPDGIIPSFRDQEALDAYANLHRLDLDAMEPLVHDLDGLAQWLRRPLSAEIDLDAFLTAWNLFGDLAISVNCHFDRDRKRTQQVYEKLFWGNNLPAVTPPGKQYTPHWSDDELLLMREILQYGLLLFRKHVKML